MSDQNRSNLKGVGLALTAFAIFATHDVAVKLLGQTFLPFQIIFFSVLLGFPLATVMLMRDPQPGTLRPLHPWWMALRAGASTLTGISAFYAFSTLPLAQVYAFLFASPILITLLAIPILGEKVGLFRGTAVVVGLFGVIILLRPGGSPISLGHIAALVAAAGSATTAVVTRKIGREERAVVMVLYPMIAAFVFNAAFLPFVYVPMPLSALGLEVVVAVLGFLGMLLTVGAYRAAPAAVVAPLQYSQLVWAVIYGALLFDETVDLMTWIGAGIIVSSGLVIVFREAFGGGSETRPVIETKRRPESIAPRVGTILMARATRSYPGHEALAKPGRAE